MTSYRSTIAAATACLVFAALVPAAAASTPAPRADGRPIGDAKPSSSAVQPVDGMPCVHRGITFFCGRVPNFKQGPGVVTTLQFSFGNPGDRPVFGDWNGDGNRTAGVFRPSTITWFLSNTDSAGDPPLQLTYGEPGDLPLVGDWDGTGTQKIGTYRPSNATFYLRNTNTSGVADRTITLGNPGDIPLAGDFDQTGITRIGVYRPDNQTFYFAHGSGPVTATRFGDPGDRPFAGAYWCNPPIGAPVEAVFGVFRPSNLTWYGLCYEFGPSSPFFGSFRYGDSTDQPLLK